MNHAQQRTSRLWSGDDLFRLVDAVPTLKPEPIPIGEAHELTWQAQPFPAAWSALTAAAVRAAAN
jgi:hypothetical protein